MKETTMIQCEKNIHRDLKVFCALYDIKRLDLGIDRLLQIAQT